MHRRNDETNEEKEEKESSFPPFPKRKKEDDEAQHFLVFLLCFLPRVRKQTKPLKGGTLFLASLRERIFCRFVSTFCFPILLLFLITDTNTTLEERRGWRKDLEKADLLKEDQEDQR